MTPSFAPRGRRALAVLAILAGLACRGADDRPPPAAGEVAGSAQAAAPSVTAADRAPAELDSALAAALAHFRDRLPRTDTLRSALPSKDAVVRQFMDLLARRDTMGLARLHLSRSEWAWIVYPESRYTRAPHRQRVDIAWMLIIERSNAAAARLLARRGGQPLRVVGWECATTPEPEGRTLYWGRCVVSFRDSTGRTRTERLFSSIVERDGRFKIGSYSNQF